MRILPRLLIPFALLATGCSNWNFYSDEELEPLSVQAYEQATSEYPVITSGAEYRMVQDVANRITAVTGVDFPWQARLLKADDVPNAFCLPNGRIAIYTGILKVTENVDGLAAVMGHEVAHATMRHGGKRMTQSSVTQALLTVAGQSLDLSEMGDDSKGWVMTALGMGAQYGHLLPFSREHETEADVEGIRYAIRAGFDPWEAPKLWERMAKLGDGGPEFLSTHPDPLNRARKLRDVIPQIIEQEKGWKPGGTP